MNLHSWTNQVVQVLYTAQSCDSDTLSLSVPQKFQSWCFERPPFLSMNIFHPWPTVSDKARSHHWMLLKLHFGKTFRVESNTRRLDFLAAATVYKEERPFTSSTDSTDNCPEKQEVNYFKTKDESFPGLDWFAGNLPGTEASSVR